MNQLTNHLWQSTVFASAVALIALALRRNSARLRYWLWLAASLKFLIPFSVLVTIGGGMAKPTAAPVLRALTVERVSTYFAPAPTFPAPMPSAAPSYWRLAILALWAAGAVFFLIRWRRRWLAIRNAARTGKPLPAPSPLPAISSPSMMEPGVFGLFHPILLLPEGLADSLTPEQFQAIFAHELCHVRYRDNLTASLHMCVETLIWFHPIVWWIGAKLVEERERACDESVLNAGSQPAQYAQGIVNVCRTYVESPLPCVSGITGTGLKKRIREIMTWRGSLRLTFARKSMLAIAGVVAVTVPLAIGVIRAQTLPPPPAYTYDVVSIHKSKPGQGFQSNIGPRPGGGMRTQNTTALQLVTFAYGVQDFQIVGAPDWTKSDRFDVTFTADKTERTPGPATKRTDSSIGPFEQRLQAVLRDRFGLVIRTETHELPIYALAPAKGGLKVTPSADATRGSSFTSAPGRITAIGATFRLLAIGLAGILGRPVIDETDSDEKYDFNLEFAPETPIPPGPGEPAPPADAPSLFTALSEQLGLRLESRKGPVPVFVIEKIEKPSEN